MRALRFSFLLAVLAARTGCSGGEAASRAPEERHAIADVRVPDRPIWHIRLDTHGKRLGAYTIAIRYNPEIAVIEKIQAVESKLFKGTPECDPATLASGVTRVAAFDAFPGRAPVTDYHLFSVVFRRVTSGTLEATAKIEKLYDESNKPFLGRITAERFEHTFP